MALVHPVSPHAGAYYLHGRQLGYTDPRLAALRDHRDPRLLAARLHDAHPRRRQPAPADDVGRELAHYSLYIEARHCKDGILDGGYTLLRLGPYTQTRHAQCDYDRLTAALDGHETTLVPGHRVCVRFGPFDVSDHQLFTDPYEADAVALLDAAVAR